MFAHPGGASRTHSHHGWGVTRWGGRREDAPAKPGSMNGHGDWQTRRTVWISFRRFVLVYAARHLHRCPTEVCESHLQQLLQQLFILLHRCLLYKDEVPCHVVSERHAPKHTSTRRPKNCGKCGWRSTSSAHSVPHHQAPDSLHIHPRPTRRDEGVPILAGRIHPPHTPQ